MESHPALGGLLVVGPWLLFAVGYPLFSASITSLSVTAAAAAQVDNVKPHYFGGLPDLQASSGAGVRLSAVRPDSPAARAGLQAGDVIVKLGASVIRTADDLSAALRSERPGQPLEVVYIRQGVEHHAQTILQGRR